jgi:hypothetical protein
MKTNLLSIIAILILSSAANAQTLESYYSFDDETTDDQVGDNHGVNNGATPVEDRFGNANAAMHFDGSSSIEVGDSSELNLNNITAVSVSCWIKHDVFPTGNNLMGIVTKWSGSASSEQYGLFSKTDDHLWAIGGVASSGIALNGDIDSTWTHVVVSYDMINTSVEYYINGARVDSVTIGAMPPTTGTSSLFIGSQNTGRFFEGDIDDVKIFSSALDSSMVADLYNEQNPLASVEEINSTQVSVYPNPAVSTINISAIEKVEEVMIFNISGELVIDNSLNVSHIDVSDLPSGLYIIKVKTDQGLHRSKFVKD